MILPPWLQDKVNELYLSLNKKILTETRENLTKRYKEHRKTLFLYSICWQKLSENGARVF